MADIIGKKGFAAYKALDLFRRKKQHNSVFESKTLSAVTRPPAVVALAAAAYGASRFSDSKKLQNTLLRATLSSALAGLVNAGLKRVIGRRRPRATMGPAFKGFSLDDKHNSMPSGHAAAVTAVAASLPKSYGPLLAAGAATAIIGRSRTKRDAHHFTDVLVGGCVGFASAHLVSKLLKKSGKSKYKTKTTDNTKQADGTDQTFSQGDSYQSAEQDGQTSKAATSTNQQNEAKSTGKASAGASAASKSGSSATDKKTGDTKAGKTSAATKK
ncbi:phosphatase PAP2 family protein [Salinimonas marina]|uniref:undecaprenyl-diphosphate phosphatase n=1 Tax=Salinimonas marina TaxID=2785918 RepID=A0A7S9DZJ6_9ALTE|nr:phosphatase PAP2 family protein [Salinimonas marina]QPG06834.1 phosphatase PAP2 family protein [Salinimonas marina]